MTFDYKFDDLFNPVLVAIHNLGDSCTVGEMEEEIRKILSLTEQEINDIHRGNITKLSYRLAWARNYLKRYGLIENSERGVWRLTDTGKITRSVDKDEVYSSVKSLDKNSLNLSFEKREELEHKTSEIKSIEWKEILLKILKDIEPVKFEKLCMLLLRELGFIDVNITKQTNDGGIDGFGIIKVGEVVSFTIVFQCKRYKEVVPSNSIRDFRGALIGRAEKGLVLTTGTFSAEAKKEARRDGAPQIDLIDGYSLCELLKKTKLGVETKMVEEVEIEEFWFKNI